MAMVLSSHTGGYLWSGGHLRDLRRTKPLYSNLQPRIDSPLRADNLWINLPSDASIERLNQAIEKLVVRMSSSRLGPQAASD